VGSHPEILRKRTGKWGESYCTSPAFSAKMKKFLNQKKKDNNRKYDVQKFF
jgi:hypothetical protein